MFQDVQLMKTSKDNFNNCQEMEDIDLSVAGTLSLRRIGRGAFQRYVEANNPINYAFHLVQYFV